MIIAETRKSHCYSIAGLRSRILTLSRFSSPLSHPSCNPPRYSPHPHPSCNQPPRSHPSYNPPRCNPPSNPSYSPHVQTPPQGLSLSHLYTSVFSVLTRPSNQRCEDLPMGALVTVAAPKSAAARRSLSICILGFMRQQRDVCGFRAGVFFGLSQCPERAGGNFLLCEKMSTI